MAERPWQPEHPVDRELARELIGSQFPALSGQGVERLGQGWDVDVWRCGEFCFRFPRRALGIATVENELAVLPGLAARLPLPIPVPSHVGRASARFAAPFYGHRYLAGTSADRARLGHAARLSLAPAIGRFLRALHTIGSMQALVLGVGPDTFRGDMRRTAQRALQRMELLERTPWAAYLPRARASVQSPPPDVEGTPATLLHGDCYARHLLLDDLGELAAVIDWGDVCLGDAAVDLSIATTFLPPEARASFWSAYGPTDGATRARARHIGLARYGIQLLAYAVDVGDADLEREAGLALEHSLA